MQENSGAAGPIPFDPAVAVWARGGYTRGHQMLVSTLIEIDEEGTAWLTGSNVKVIEIVLDKRAYGWSPEEIHFQHPGLSLAQIHAALSYYYENQERLDAEIDRRRKEAEQLAAEGADSPLRRRLLALKKSR